MIGMLKGLKLAQEVWLALSVLKSGVEPLRETKVGGDLKGSLSVGWSVGQFWTLAGLTVSRAFQRLQRRESKGGSGFVGIFRIKCFSLEVLSKHLMKHLIKITRFDQFLD